VGLEPERRLEPSNPLPADEPSGTTRKHPRSARPVPIAMRWATRSPRLRGRTGRPALPVSRPGSSHDSLHGDSASPLDLRDARLPLSPRRAIGPERDARSQIETSRSTRGRAAGCPFACARPSPVEEAVEVSRSVVSPSASCSRPSRPASRRVPRPHPVPHPGPEGLPLIGSARRSTPPVRLLFPPHVVAAGQALPLEALEDGQLRPPLAVLPLEVGVALGQVLTAEAVGISWTWTSSLRLSSRMVSSARRWRGGWCRPRGRLLGVKLVLDSASWASPARRLTSLNRPSTRRSAWPSRRGGPRSGPGRCH
jgi:hypothetical protein